MKKLHFIFATILLISMQTLFAQTVEGKWKTIDDETGEAKSIVEIYQKDGKFYGKIVKILNPDRQDAKCDKCDGARKDQPILGMVIIDGLVKDDNEYKDGKILDPQKGKEYKCKIWLEEDDANTLNVRGYVAFFYRTQNWYRVD